MSESPEFFSYWLILPALIFLGFVWVWDGTAKDKRDTYVGMFWVFVVLVLARYLP